jgi:hypothetical protein
MKLYTPTLAQVAAARGPVSRLAPKKFLQLGAREVPVPVLRPPHAGEALVGNLRALGLDSSVRIGSGLYNTGLAASGLTEAASSGVLWGPTDAVEAEGPVPNVAIVKNSVGTVELTDLFEVNDDGHLVITADTQVPVNLAPPEEFIDCFHPMRNDARKALLHIASMVKAIEDQIEALRDRVEDGAINVSESMYEIGALMHSLEILDNSLKNGDVESIIRTYNWWWTTASEHQTLSQLRTEHMPNLYYDVYARKTAKELPMLVKIASPFSRWNKQLSDNTATQMEHYLIPYFKLHVGSKVGVTNLIDSTGASLVYPDASYDRDVLADLVDNLPVDFAEWLREQVEADPDSHPLLEVRDGEVFVRNAQTGIEYPLSEILADDFYVGATRLDPPQGVDLEKVLENVAEFDASVSDAVFAGEVRVRALAEKAKELYEARDVTEGARSRILGDEFPHADLNLGEGYYPEGYIPQEYDLYMALFGVYHVHLSKVGSNSWQDPTELRRDLLGVIEENPSLRQIVELVVWSIPVNTWERSVSEEADRLSLDNEIALINNSDRMAVLADVVPEEVISRLMPIIRTFERIGNENLDFEDFIRECHDNAEIEPIITAAVQAMQNPLSDGMLFQKELRLATGKMVVMGSARRIAHRAGNYAGPRGAMNMLVKQVSWLASFKEDPVGLLDYNKGSSVEGSLEAIDLSLTALKRLVEFDLVSAMFDSRFAYKVKPEFLSLVVSLVFGEAAKTGAVDLQLIICDIDQLSDHMKAAVAMAREQDALPTHDHEMFTLEASIRQAAQGFGLRAGGLEIIPGSVREGQGPSLPIVYSGWGGDEVVIIIPRRVEGHEDDISAPEYLDHWRNAMAYRSQQVSPEGTHKVVFDSGDGSKQQRWPVYTTGEGDKLAIELSKQRLVDAYLAGEITVGLQYAVVNVFHVLPGAPGGGYFEEFLLSDLAQYMRATSSLGVSATVKQFRFDPTQSLSNLQLQFFDDVGWGLHLVSGHKSVHGRNRTWPFEEEGYDPAQSSSVYQATSMPTVLSTDMDNNGQSTGNGMVIESDGFSLNTITAMLMVLREPPSPDALNRLLQLSRIP